MQRRGPNTPPGSYFDGSSSMDLSWSMTNTHMKSLLKSCFHYMPLKYAKRLLTEHLKFAGIKFYKDRKVRANLEICFRVS